MKKRKCGNCHKTKSEKDFTRRSTEDGLIESDFVYCNKCVKY